MREENKARRSKEKSASRDFGPPVPVAPRRNAGDGNGNEFNSLGEEMEVEADRFARRKVERLEGEIPFTKARATAAGASREDDSVRRRGGWKSNKGTGGMESSVVLFKPRIHLFACTHPSVSNSLDCNDWLAYKHQSSALCLNTFGLWFLVVCKHQYPPCVSKAMCFKTV